MRENRTKKPIRNLLNPQHRTMTKWQYRIDMQHASHDESVMNATEEEDYLNKMGQQGWECYQSTRVIFYFKRPLPPETIPADIKP